MRPAVVVTGASAGIGAELARVFSEHGHELVLVARREERLNALAEEIAAAGRPRPAVAALDLARPDVAERLGEALAARDLEPSYIVNNAGFGLFGEAAEVERDRLLAMIDVNIRALTALSLAFVPSLERHRGGVLNLASVAGFFPGPHSAVYYATKAFVISFSEALRSELAPRRVRVTALCPGPVPSEFQLRAGARRETYPPMITVSARRVAEEGYRGLMAGRALVVPGFANQVISRLPRILPRGVMLRLVAARQLRRRGIEA